MHPTVWLTVQDQIAHYAEQRLQTEQRLAESRRLFDHLLTGEVSENWERWKDLAGLSHSHLYPDFDEPPGKVYTVDPNPPEGVLIATDGSQIFSSRHEVAPVALIHISRIRINYKNYQEPPLMDSTARLLMPEEIHLEEEISGENLVSDQRTLEEMSTLADLAEEAHSRYDSSMPLVALTDGSLILWSIAGRHEREYEKGMIGKYINSLERMQKVQVPTAGYISRPGSREVYQLLQLAWSSTAGKEDQEKPLPLTDSVIFLSLLKPGQRSILFHSRSQILNQYGNHRVSFFYMNVGDEIARIEVPHWVAQSAAWMECVASQCLRQARLGGGYPIILSEAHEAAVIRSADRETFYALIQQQLLERGVYPRLSYKQLRKKVSIL